MILVDVQVPAMGQSYDFELEEEMSVGEAIAEVVSLIADREKWRVCSGEKMYFYFPRREILLQDEFSLRQQGIQNGEKLMLL